jgi:GTPase Era involved in 16S rRNA processing
MTRTTVTLSLVSHTNVGKTTLARTLLRKDIGEVLDLAHVTEVSEAHTLIETDDAQLCLWDTPGFGDTLRLVQRLRREKGPIGWFLHEVWDRNTDRPLWCSQEAVRNVRDDADVVLYLVNASEDPEDAGYVRHELEILGWIGRPVLVLLNQTGAAGRPTDELEARWREATATHDAVRGVMPLDAFTRSWVQEVVLLERVRDLLPPEKRAAMDALAHAWHERNLAVFETSLERMAAHLARAACDREPMSGGTSSRERRRAAMAGLAHRLERSERELWDAVIAAHGLDGRWASEVRRRLDDFLVTGEEPLSAGKAALVGSVVSGALGGLATDVLAGGLTLGGGLIAGAILGALGGAGLSRAVHWVKTPEAPAITWSQEFLDLLFQQTVLRYLAVAHFGRGRGRFQGAEEPAAWREAIASAFARRRGELAALWRRGFEAGSEARAALEPRLAEHLRRDIASVLGDAYPEARGKLGASGG